MDSITELLKMLPGIFSAFVIPGVVVAWRLTTQLALLNQQINQMSKDWRDATDREKKEVETIYSSLNTLNKNFHEHEKVNMLEHERLRNAIQSGKPTTH